MHISRIEIIKPSERKSKDLLKYVEMGRELGADLVEVIPSSIVEVSQLVKMKCQVPRCYYFGECANCPPFSPSVAEIKEVITGCKDALLIACKVEPVDDFINPEMVARKGQAHYRKVSKLVSKIERAAFLDGYYLSVGFAAGCCKFYLCNDYVCQYLVSKKCRFPLMSRPSMESVGIDVFKLVSRIGWEIYPIGGKSPQLKTIPFAVLVGIVFIC